MAEGAGWIPASAGMTDSNGTRAFSEGLGGTDRVTMNSRRSWSELVGGGGMFAEWRVTRRLGPARLGVARPRLWYWP